MIRLVKNSPELRWTQTDHFNNSDNILTNIWEQTCCLVSDVFFYIDKIFFVNSFIFDFEINQYFTPFIWPMSFDVKFMKTLNCDICDSLEHDREGFFFIILITNFKTLLMTMVSNQLKTKIEFFSFLFSYIC